MEPNPPRGQAPAPGLPPGWNRQGPFSAFSLAACGLFPFPLRPHDPADPSAFKRPRFVGWQEMATGSTAEQRQAWDGQGWNLGIYLQPSRLVVIDTDTPDAEEWALRSLPETPWQTRTAKGRHRFYRLAEGQGVPVDNKPIAGMDRKANGYVLAPGSWHFGARLEYAPEGDWKAPKASLPIYCPAWFPLTVQGHQGCASPVYRFGNAHERARRYCQALPPAVQGQGGHRTLLTAALKLASTFPDLTAPEIDDLLWMELNPRCCPPWGDMDRADFSRKTREAFRLQGRPL